MSKGILKQNYWPSIIKYCKDHQKEVKFEKCQQPIKNTALNRITTTHIFKLLADSHSKHTSKSFSNLTRFLANHQHLQLEKPIKDSIEEQQESLAHLVSKLSALAIYQFPVSNELKKIQQILLFDSLPPSQHHILLSLMKVTSIPFSISKKIDQIVLDWFYQHSASTENQSQRASQILQTNRIVASKLRKDKLTERSKNNDTILYALDKDQTQQYSLHSTFHSRTQLIRLALFQNSAIKKRIIYKLLQEDSDPLDQDLLPGSNWKNQEELSEAIEFLKKLGKFAPFVDLLQGMEQKNHLQANWMKKRPVIFNKIIDYYFNFLSNGHWTFRPAHISSFLSFQSKTAASIDELLANQPACTVMKLLTLLEQFKRYDLNSESSEQILSKLVQSAIKIIEQKQLNKDKLLLQNQYEGEMVSIYLLIQTCSNLQIENSQPNPNNMTLNLLSPLMKNLAESHPNSTFIQQAAELFEYCLALHKGSVSSGVSIIYCQAVSQTEIQNIIESYLDSKDLPYSNEQKIAQYVENHFILLKKIVLQPNLNISYILTDKTSNQALFGFDCRDEHSSSWAFEGDQPQIEISSSIDERVDLNIYGYWKQEFVQTVTNINYCYCRTQEELHLKICQAMQIDQVLI